MTKAMSESNLAKINVMPIQGGSVHFITEEDWGTCKVVGVVIGHLQIKGCVLLDYCPYRLCGCQYLLFTTLFPRYNGVNDFGGRSTGGNFESTAWSSLG